MHKFIAVIFIILTATISSKAHAGAVALCIEKSKNIVGNYYDSEYFLRDGKSPNVNGYTALKAAKEDHRKSYPNSVAYCRHNGSKFQNGGYFVVIKSGRTKDLDGGHHNRWALGFGANRYYAIRDAKAELRRRDPLWSESRHKYTIVKSKILSEKRPVGAMSVKPTAKGTVQRGAAMCVSTRKGSTGKTYHQAYALSIIGNGYRASKNAQADLRKRKYNGKRQCKNSGTYFPAGGYWVIKERNMKNHKDGSPSTAWVLGIGNSKSAAIADANAELSNIGILSNWYSVIREGRF